MRCENEEGIKKILEGYRLALAEFFLGDFYGEFFQAYLVFFFKFKYPLMASRQTTDRFQCFFPLPNFTHRLKEPQFSLVPVQLSPRHHHSTCHTRVSVPVAKTRLQKPP